MQATDILSSEHRVIERVINSLEQATRMLEEGQTVPAEFFLDAATFIKGFADGCHHVKEEKVLFQTMLDNGLPLQGGPVAVMLAEHEQGRDYVKGMRSAAQRLQAGDQSAITDLINNTRGYAALLRAHINKEDTILFPMADRVIPLDQHDTVLDGFERVEHEETGEGVHEKYLALAEKLEAVLA